MQDRKESFGVVSACYGPDYALVKATCASVRYFMPRVPIAIIVDFDVCVEELVRVYDVTVLRTNNYKTEFPVSLSGTYFSKWIAFLESPFDKFVYLDSDAIVCGDIRTKLQLENYDFIVPNEMVKVSESEMNTWWFDAAVLAKLDPDFDPACCPLFCAGAFASRAGLLTRVDIAKLLALYREYEDSFRFQDQGLFNYAVFSKQQRGEIKVATVPIQIAAPDLAETEFLKKFSLDAVQKGSISSASVLHYCGVKPYIQYRSRKARLFTWFRFRFFRDAGVSLPIAWTIILAEETQHALGRVRKKLARWYRGAARILRGAK